MNILITGAASGIGHNLWKHYVSSGQNVIIVGRRKELLDNMARNFPEHTHSVLYYISQTGSFDNVLGNILRGYGRIDLAGSLRFIKNINSNMNFVSTYGT